MKQYFKNTWDGLWTVLVGMKITFKHLFTPAVTIQYPEVKVDMVDRARNRLYVNIDDCIGCDQCARACPVNCITIDTVKGVPGEDLGKTSNGKKKALWITKFEIDFAKCCTCSLCVYPCPTECIKMTSVHEFSEYERENLKYNFSALTEAESEEKKKNYAVIEAEKAAQKAAAPAKPAAAAKPAVAKPAAESGNGDGAAPAVKAVKAEEKTEVKPETPLAPAASEIPSKAVSESSDASQEKQQQV